MRMLLAASLCALSLSACVTEVNGIEREPLPEPSKPSSPLARAEDDVSRLIERMRYETGTQLYGTMKTIAGFKAIARRPLTEALEGADARMRSNILYLLGYIGGPEAQPVLARYLADPEPAVRLEAAAGLLGLGDMAGVPVLLPMLESESVQLRFKAHEALSKLTRQDFGYDASAPIEARSAALARWQSWWSAQRERLLFQPRTELPASAAPAEPR